MFKEKKNTIAVTFQKGVPVEKHKLHFKKIWNLSMQ